MEDLYLIKADSGHQAFQVGWERTVKTALALEDNGYSVANVYRVGQLTEVTKDFLDSDVDI